jgi:hypothetical protein
MPGCGGRARAWEIGLEGGWAMSSDLYFELW